MKYKPTNMTPEVFKDWMLSNPQTKIDTKTKCIVWQLAKTPEGYGITYHWGRKTYVHRLIWYLTYKYWSDKLVLHSCNNVSCINVDHLFEGTYQDSMNEMKRKGRTTIGAKNGNAKLTEQEVIAIKNLYKTGKYSQTKLAELYAISKESIRNILRRKTWKHVD